MSNVKYFITYLIFIDRSWIIILIYVKWNFIMEGYNNGIKRITRFNSEKQ